MKDLIYPAVLYKDEDTDGFTITIPDLRIVTEGDTVEDAFARAKSYLANFVEVAEYLGCEMDPPTDFRTMCKNNEKEIVILVDKETE